MLRVFLLDDHRLMRTACRMILGKQGDIEIVGEAGSGEEALPLLRQLKPDVVICDLHLPGMSGLEVTERIVRAGQGVKVLM
ncbi:MAG TPA: response regulator transcription factor, partial [Arenimonas sp.]|nr:response regulator transcription factor [Arenimonas sp.]